MNGKNQESVRAKKKTGADLGGVQGEHTPLPRDDIQLSTDNWYSAVSYGIPSRKKNTGSALVKTRDFNLNDVRLRGKMKLRSKRHLEEEKEDSGSGSGRSASTIPDKPNRRSSHKVWEF